MRTTVLMNDLKSPRLQNSLQRISDLLAWFIQKVKADNAAGLLDINRISEDILVPIFSEVYGYAALRNLNVSENYPGIDLGDESAQVAFQVTSEKTSDKIKDTLEKFIKYAHYKRYKHLIVYIITEKQSSYAGTGWDQIIGERFTFSKSDDIRDYSDLLQAIRRLPLERMTRIESILEYHFAVQQVPVGELINIHVQKQLAREKNSKKYIPDICVEVAEIKDRARFFSHPALFFQKTLDDVARLNFSEINRVLMKLDMQPVQLDWNYDSSSQATVTSVQDRVESLREALQQIKNEVYKYSFPWRCQTELDEKAVPPHKRYVYKDMKFFLGRVASGLLLDIENLLKSLEAISSRVLFIVGRAGQGKTNFVCDLAETVLLRRSIPCVFFTGREFNHVAPEGIAEYFVKSIFGSRVDDLDAALKSLSEFAIKSDVPIIIIIDGINEHRNIQDFAHHLEKFVERTLEYQHLKVVLTCRSEYFEERFSNFRQASFAEEILFVADLERHMSKVHRGRMLDGYLRFFNLQPSYISERAAEVLENDTLLLRMFCEVYGDVSAEERIILPQIRDIYREKIFREYLERKISGALEYDDAVSKLRIGSKQKYQRVLKSIIQLMIQRNQYADIPIVDLPEEYYDALAILLGEDIIIRKDLAVVGDVLDERAEVVNFTFDEFRDFLLADHLASIVFRKDPQGFEAVVDQIVAPKSPVAEGVRTYLFFASRRPVGRGILNVIGKKEWFSDIFVKSIFSVEEEFITQDDLSEIKKKFHESEHNALWIIRMLVWRWRVSWYTRLNIHLLFDILGELSTESYNELVVPCLKQGSSPYEEYDHSYIKRLTNDLAEALDSENFSKDIDFLNLMELLIYLFPVREHGVYTSPSFHTFTKFADIESEKAITLLSKYTKIRNLGIRLQVWRMLTHLARRNRINTDLVEEACESLLKIEKHKQPQVDSLAREIVRFLEVSAEQQKIRYEDSVVE